MKRKNDAYNSGKLVSEKMTIQYTKFFEDSLGWVLKENSSNYEYLQSKERKREMEKNMVLLEDREYFKIVPKTIQYSYLPNEVIIIYPKTGTISVLDSEYKVENLAELNSVLNEIFGEIMEKRRKQEKFERKQKNLKNIEQKYKPIIRRNLVSNDSMKTFDKIRLEDPSICEDGVFINLYADLFAIVNIENSIYWKYGKIRYCT